jgi:hypothetical protein
LGQAVADGIVGVVDCEVQRAVLNGFLGQAVEVVVGVVDGSVRFLNAQALASGAEGVGVLFDDDTVQIANDQ